MIINQAYAEDAQTNIQVDTITLKDSDSLPQPPESLGNSWTSIVPMVLIFVVF